MLRKENPPAPTPSPRVPPAAVGPEDPREAEDLEGAPREKELVEGWPAAPVPKTKPGFVAPIPAKAEEGASAADVA